MVDTEGSIDPRYFLPVSEAPVIDRKIPKSAFEFDTMFEDGVISNAKIRRASIGSAEIGTISFSQLSGGTATLGGVSDGDGLLTVKNAGGTEVVRLDNTGITITAGTISNIEIGTVSWTSGTIVNSFIGTSQFTGGSVNSASLGTNTFTGGTVKNALVGTCQITGGTVDPSLYKISGTSGVSGTIVYLNSGTLLGTIVVQLGLITSIT